MRFDRHLKFSMTLLFALSLCIGATACGQANEEGQVDSAKSQEPTQAQADGNAQTQTEPQAQTATSKDNSGAAQANDAIANAKPDDPYVSDEVCLSCHGGTYEAIEELTADYGDSNPHGGTHGWGGASCNECHTDGSSKPADENNQCLVCHAWPRNDQSLIEYMDL